MYWSTIFVKLCSPITSCLLLLTCAFERSYQRRIPDIWAWGLPEAHSIDYSRSPKARTLSPRIPRSNSASDLSGMGAEWPPLVAIKEGTFGASSRQRPHAGSLGPPAHCSYSWHKEQIMRQYEIKLPAPLSYSRRKITPVVQEWFRQMSVYSRNSSDNSWQHKE